MSERQRSEYLVTFYYFLCGLYDSDLLLGTFLRALENETLTEDGQGNEDEDSNESSEHEGASEDEGAGGETPAT